MWSQYG
jgi:hypothetical protein